LKAKVLVPPEGNAYHGAGRGSCWYQLKEQSRMAHLERTVRRLAKHPKLVGPVGRARLWFSGIVLWVAFVVGRVPFLTVRMFVYRRVLRMDLATNVTMHWRTVFFHPGGVRIGRNTIVGNDCFLDGRDGLTIGSNVNIGGHVHIFTLEHDPNASDFGAKGGPVIVGDRAYIASRSTILPGVTIGEGAVVAAGAVVTKDVAPFEIVGGVPAKHISWRRKDVTYELDFHMPLQ
jgi:maltose O-acetyltransferase